MHILSQLLPVVAEISSRDESGVVFGGVGGFVGYVLFVAAVWPFLNKAGQPGWTALIPVVAAFFIVRAAGLSAWWTLLYLVPIANVVLAIIVALRLGRAFGHGAVFSVFLLWLLSLIGYFVISYSSDTYRRARI
ncbi:MULTISPECIES: DUF5684 domain-containing protein [unclassified Microbacterium]|uniref:DUF5684 domain-containing protein n=1 Tax=unclassified Microbacterium TaxID=2609290 RepID=UPI00214BE6E8|nr:MULTISPECIES: DUF5684 domain-containing protein [unclassified Microbacterium]MCR2800482.1 DUF5684 domain-containing protein [Microbacterium sp. zg.Y818]MCR2825353.1 DUF5684 domain-containing protein [Microbacterium sp. zg.Y909]WIM22438.1 DUF5684 domain-containing protein [Microbacterium sp. zg-Y818]